MNAGTTTIEPPSDRVIRSQVEPRIVERRRQVRDAGRRRRRRRWIAFGIVVALLAAVIGVLTSPLTDIDEISVSGIERLDIDRVVAASGAARGEQLLTADLAAIRDALRGQPWISSASVTRQWPDTLVVSVLEEQPLAVVDLDGSRLVVSRTGRVLVHERDAATADVVVDTAALPVLEVEGADVGELQVGDDLPTAVLRAAMVFDRMPEALRGELTVARLDADGALTFELPDDATLVIGPVEDIPQKLASTEAVLGQVVRACMATVDVREPGRPTVARTEGCDLPAPTDSAPGDAAATDSAAGDSAAGDGAADDATGAPRAGGAG